ncbi:MAG TPA: DMT family transporter [Saprospiraceae bacterium]|nr:DMT family transporter [Saprospiraceae bacterium]
MQNPKPGIFDWSLLLFLTLIWGFSYYFIKHSLEGFNPTQVASLRMVIGAAALLPFLPQAFRLIPRELLGTIFFVGLVGSFLPAFLYPFAQQKISSSLAGIINAFTPICTFGIGVLFFQVKNERLKFIGTIIALTGAIFLILFKPNAELRAEGFYLLVAFSVPFLYGINGNTIKAKLGSIPGIPMTAAMYASLLVLCIPMAWWSGGFQQIPVALSTGNSFYHLLALSVLGSALAMALFNVLIQRVHVLFAASVTYLMPLVSLVVGWFDGESIHWNDFVGLGCILTGVLIMNGVLAKKAETVLPQESIVRSE